MTTRRSLIAAASVLTAPFAGFAPAVAQASQPRFRFGLIADPQYAPVAPRRTRFYANSLWKVAEAAEALNAEKLEFVVTLGDIIDRHWESYGHILPVYDRLKHPHFFVLGNHDYEVAADFLGSVHRVTGLRRAYYDFPGGGYRFVVLDGNDVSLFANPAGSAKRALATKRLEELTAAKAPNAQPWNGGMSEDQWTWLSATLERARAANEKVILLCHYPVWPHNEHNMWDYEKFVELVSTHPSVVAFFNGHNHAGNYGQLGGKHFVNLKGMVETPDKTAFSVIEVWDDRLELRGFGLEESRTLKI